MKFTRALRNLSFSAFQLFSFCFLLPSALFAQSEAVKVANTGTGAYQFSSTIVAANSGTGANQFANGADTQAVLDGKQATTWTASGSGAVSRSVTGKLDETLSVKDYEAVGDGVTDDTAEIQAAILAASGTYSRAVFFPAGDYKISSALDVARSGVQLIGESAETTRITQSSTGANGINIIADIIPTEWGGQTREVRIKNLHIRGSGTATSTGRGINIDGTGGLIGQAIHVDQCVIRGWQTGYYNRRSDQSSIINSVIAYCGTGVDADTTANSLVLLNTGIAQCAVECMVLGTANGSAIIGGDFGNSPRVARLLSGATITWTGGNFETVTGSGTEFIKLESGATLRHFGGRFLNGGAVTADCYNVAGTATLVTDTSAKRADVSSYVVGLPSNASALATPSMITAESGDQYSVGPFPGIRDDSGLITTATTATRGQIFRVIGRSGSADSIVAHLRNAAGTFSVHTLSGRAGSGGNTDITTLTGLNTGSAANPPIRSTSGGATTGIFFRSGEVGFSSGGVEKAAADSTGFYQGTTSAKIRIGHTGTTAAPADAVTPVGWTDMVITGTTYKVPLYQ